MNGSALDFELWGDATVETGFGLDLLYRGCGFTVLQFYRTGGVGVLDFFFRKLLKKLLMRAHSRKFKRP